MNTKSADLSLLRLLLVLLETRNVTHAARRLNTSQSALSNRLARLRRLVGDPLFLPRQRGLVPTERALSLGRDVAPLLRALDQLVSPAVFEPAQVDGVFRIVATDYAVHTVLLPALEELRRRAPGLAVTILRADSLMLGQALEAGQVDLAITIPQSAPRSARRRLLFRDDYVLVAAPDHPVLARVPDDTVPDLDVVCALDYVLVSPDGGTLAGPADEALRRVGRQRRVVVSVPGFLAAVELVARTQLVTLLPRRLAAAATGDRIATYAFPVDVPAFDLIAVWHERAHKDALHRWARGILFA